MPRLINVPIWLNEEYDRSSAELIDEIKKAFPCVNASAEALYFYLGSDLPEDRDAGQWCLGARSHEDLIGMNVPIIYDPNEETVRSLLPSLLLGALILHDTEASPAEGDVPQILLNVLTRPESSVLEEWLDRFGLVNMRQARLIRDVIDHLATRYDTHLAAIAALDSFWKSIPSGSAG